MLSPFFKSFYLFITPQLFGGVHLGISATLAFVISNSPWFDALEIKRELLDGELAPVRQAVLPAVAALGVRIGGQPRSKIAHLMTRT